MMLNCEPSRRQVSIANDRCSEAGMSPYSGWELDGSPFTSPQDQPQQSPVELPIDGRERIPVSRFKRSTVENGARFSWFDQPDEEDMQRMM